MHLRQNRSARHTIIKLTSAWLKISTKEKFVCPLQIFTPLVLGEERQNNGCWVWLRTLNQLIIEYRIIYKLNGGIAPRIIRSPNYMYKLCTATFHWEKRSMYRDYTYLIICWGENAPSKLVAGIKVFWIWRKMIFNM